ncbi:hypothetical protein [Argonema antarcticum]|uniref:hypothetical protein n=1 Tax=Argonema antarcticum TaxID=2942763 RepID=UPI002011335F|nr:hypothetical protein [Argonema antarcticum]MCL1474704.1 hypothetical protein [Argonema antarcticum A004/B2]
MAWHKDGSSRLLILVDGYWSLVIGHRSKVIALRAGVFTDNGKQHRLLDER